MRLVSCLRLIATTGILVVFTAGGCRDDSDAPKVHHLKGRVTKIDASSGIVTGLFWIEKQGREMELSGKLAPDAEIIINGRTATLEDVQIDDSVEVTGWEEKRSSEKRLIAKKVEVVRPTSETQPAGATRPAEPSDS